MKASELAAELRRLAAELDAEGGEHDAAKLLDRLAHRVLPADAAELAHDEDWEHINEVDCNSLANAMIALMQSGVVSLEVHPAFFRQWREMLVSREVARVDQDGNLLLTARCKGTDDAGQYALRVGVWKSCGDSRCVQCKVLGRQWRHRLPEQSGPKSPDRNLN